MKRLGLLLALLLPAVPALAQKKIAVFCGLGSQTAYATTLLTLDRGGWPYDVFNSERRTWNTDLSSDDSTWFRLNGYDAVLIAYMDGQATAGPVASSGYGLRFQNQAGTAGMRMSPLSGRWGIPVFSLSPNRNLATTGTYDDLAGNNYINGILSAAPAGTFGLPTTSSWRERYLCRLRPKVDTLYVPLPTINGCVPVTWAGNGTVAALAWVDTVYTGTCADTAAIAWRWRPVAGGPGVYHFLTGAGSGGNVAALMALQYIATLTAIRPAAKCLIPITEHDPRPGLVNTVGDASLKRYHDTLGVYNIRRTIATQLHPGQFSTLFTPTTRALLRSEMTRGLLRWYPYSSNYGLSGSYVATDSAGFRQSWNAMARTGSASDSFAFPRSAYDVGRVVSPSGIAAVASAGKLLADAGTKLYETTFTSPSASGWVLQAGPVSNPQMRVTIIPDGRRINAINTIALDGDTTFTKWVGNSNWYDKVGDWTLNIYVSSYTQQSIYWHGDVHSHVDPYWAWIMSVMGRTFRYFDKVIEPDGFVNQLGQPQ